jgi:hypothetical protein
MRRHSVSNALKYATVVLKNVKSMPRWSIAKDAQRSAEIALRNAEAWQARAYEIVRTGVGEHTFFDRLKHSFAMYYFAKMDKAVPLSFNY